MSPAASTATPWGWSSAEETTVLRVAFEAFHSLMALSPVSAIKTSPKLSTAIPRGWLNPVETNVATLLLADIASITATNAGSYTAMITNVYGSVTSQVATLQIGQPPVIIAQPESISIPTGQPGTLSVGATGGQLGYQWLFDGGVLLGATSPSLAFTSATTNDAGTYVVVVSNPYGLTASSEALVTVLLLPPSIVNQPQDFYVASGQSASFAVTASGSVPLSYQWSYDGVTLAGATNALLSLSSVGRTNAGSYSVTVSNVEGSVTSAPARLGVDQPPAITVQPRNVAIVSGQTASLSVTATGTLPFSYSWQFNGTNVIPANSPILAIPIAAVSNAGSYTVVVSNGFGIITSAVAVLTVVFPPTVSVQPTNLVIGVGQTALITALTTGTPPLAFQWFANGVPVDGATTNTLSLTPLIQLRLSGF